MSKKQRIVDKPTLIAVYKELSKMCFDIAKGLLLTIVGAYIANKLSINIFFSLVLGFVGFIGVAFCLTGSVTTWKNKQKDDDDE